MIYFPIKYEISIMMPDAAIRRTGRDRSMLRILKSVKLSLVNFSVVFFIVTPHSFDQ